MIKRFGISSCVLLSFALPGCGKEEAPPAATTTAPATSTPIAAPSASVAAPAESKLAVLVTSPAPLFAAGVNGEGVIVGCNDQLAMREDLAK